LQDRWRLRRSNSFDAFKTFVDLSLDFVLIVVVVGESGVDLGEGQVRVLPMYFVGVPMVGKAIQYYLHHLGARSGDHGSTIRRYFNVRIRNRARHHSALVDVVFGLEQLDPAFKRQSLCHYGSYRWTRIPGHAATCGSRFAYGSF
jgi:hypothetical protein